MTDAEGRPLTVDVYPGNTADPNTVPDQIDKRKTRFGLSRVVRVGDRGMLRQTQIDTLRQRPGIGWLSALRSDGVRKLIDKGLVQRSLFDERNLAEIQSSDVPGERLLACDNPILHDRRRKTREQLRELQGQQDRLQADLKAVATPRSRLIADCDRNGRKGTGARHTAA